LEQYLRYYINYQRTNWSILLPLAEFAYNNTVYTFTKQTPFLANLGYHPKFLVTIPCVSKDNVALIDRMKALQDLHFEMKFNIQTAIKGHAKHFDTKAIIHPDF
jgi:hypothetical protein